MIIFFDVETTGTDPDIDHVVQLGYLVTDLKGNILKENSLIVRPDGFIIPQASINIHGITMEYATECGNSISVVMDHFMADLKKCRLSIAHNYNFDYGMIRSELDRLTISPDPIRRIRKYCTMLASTDWCGIPGYRNGYKWPKLIELYRILFGEEFTGAHDALYDVKATHRCYFELVKRGVFEAPEKRMTRSNYELT